jgi:2-polyprenyl-3-methyl-5-hydroxy-6-metoxy-1,4-benzoquinol methylase
LPLPQSSGLLVSIRLKPWNLQRESYDLIALWHVVEHMIDPWSYLIRLLPLLKPQGIIVFSTPNMFCPGVCRFPASWPWNQSPPVHLWHFGPQNLQKKLESLFPKLMIKVFTRESRDANFLFDSFIRPRFFARLPHSVGNNLRFQACVRLFVACINEALVNPFLRRKGFGGAEIIALGGKWLTIF